jgi:RNA polymerase sigma-70 factor (ECF subfamily)
MGDFETFYRSNVRLVYALVLTRTRDTGQAEDIMQETFLRAWRSFHDLHGLEAPARRAWLVRTARNLAIDVWRREGRGETVASTLADPGVERSSPELRLDVAEALDRLADQDRELVIMRYVEEMNSREIGQALGMPEGTVRRRLSRCRRVLAEHLSQWAPEERG